MAINNAKSWDEHIHASVAKQQLPWYQDRVGVVDYTDATERFAVNTTLLYGLDREPDPDTGLITPHPTAETEALIVQRGRGDGIPGSWSGVSGFVDRITAPDGTPLDQLIARTAEDEFREEGNVARADLDQIDWWADERDTWPTALGHLTLLPVVGVCQDERRPTFTPDGDEVKNYAWVPLGKLREHTDMAGGYLERTLTIGLGAIANHDTVQELLGVGQILE
jgi:hypothetical protein